MAVQQNSCLVFALLSATPCSAARHFLASWSFVSIRKLMYNLTQELDLHDLFDEPVEGGNSIRYIHRTASLHGCML